MIAENQQWQKLKHNYLKEVEQALASIDHPKSSEVLRDVDDHLERKYTELPAKQRNWEGYQQIITEMGPPEEYAELLAEEQPPTATNTFGINTFLAIIFIFVLIVVGGYLIYNAKHTSSPAPVPKDTGFEMDPGVLGKWVTIDFVQRIDDFDSTKENRQGNLFLAGLDFEPSDTVIFSFMTGQRAPNRWSQGEIYYSDEHPSRYELKTINGQIYLFVEWINSDVSVGGQEAWYYVLKKAEQQ